MAEGWRKFEKRQAVRAIDVAKAAGVSQSAVSRVFCDGSVAPKRRDKILTVAKALGYRPDAMARSIITRRSGIVAILVCENTNRECPDVLTTLCSAITTQKMRAMVFVVGSTQDVDEAVEQALAYRVDGVVALTDIAAEHAKALSELGTILVLYNREIEGVAANWIGCDHEHDGEMLARHFIADGATTLWILEGPQISSLATQRLVGLYRGLTASPARISVKRDLCDFSSESAFNAVARRLAAGEDEPDAVVALDALMFRGVAEAFRAADTPARCKIAIGGFAGSAISFLPDFDVIIITQPNERLATEAIEIIVARLKCDSNALERRTAASSLLVHQRSSYRFACSVADSAEADMGGRDRPCRCA